MKTKEKIDCVYLNHDARGISSIIGRKSVDVTITSPPYGHLKDYGSHKQIGRGQSYDEYLNSLTDIFGQIFKRTRSTGSLWIVVDTFKSEKKMKLLPFDLCNRLEGVGWILRDIVIWDKTKTLPWSRKGQLRNIFEYILFFTKTDKFKYHIERIKETEGLKEWWVRYPERYNPRGKVPTNIWTFPIPIQGSFTNVDVRHACPFPRELVERILLLTTDTGNRVLDPFAGTGMVLAQAGLMNRKYIGIDVNSEYVEQFYKYVNNDIGTQSNVREIQKTLERKRKVMEKQILKLREVKFPKALFNRLKSKHKMLTPEEVNCIVSICESLKVRKRKHEIAKITLFILCNRGANLDFESLEREARSIARKPPLSKYGLVPEIFVMPIDVFLETKNSHFLGDKKLFLYMNGHTNVPSRNLSFSEWVSQGKATWESKPPILTNIKVEQAFVSTWKPNNIRRSNFYYD